MAFNFREAATSGLYALAGTMEGLRKHREFVDADEKNRFAQRMDMERMALDRYRVETGVMQQSELLALQEKEFLDTKAKWEAQLEFEKKKLDEQRRQFGEMFPVEKMKGEAALEGAKARGTQAEAAVTRAQAATTKANAAGGALTPQGMVKLYIDTYKKQLGELQESDRQRFVKQTPERVQQHRDEAAATARDAVAGGIEAHNANAALFGFKPIGATDIQYQAEDEIEQTDVDLEWSEVKADKKFGERFENLQLTPRELELLKKFDRELWEVYEQKRLRQGVEKARTNKEIEQLRKQSSQELNRNPRR